MSHFTMILKKWLVFNFMLNIKMIFIQKKWLLICLLLANIGFAQSIKEYSFAQYKVEKIVKKNKVKINYNSNKIAKLYKTAITEGYRSGKVNFAGHYIVCVWDCGLGCLNGAMVDIFDGKVYELPMGEDRYYSGCELDDNEDYSEFQENSRLFITQTCFQYKNTNDTDTQEKEYFVNIWNEKKKKFEFISSIKKNKIIPQNN